MVVDDDSLLREMLLIALGGRHDVVCLPTGDDLVAIARCYRPDLLILDVNLPGEDGFAVCEQVRAAAGLGPLPILFLTARRDDRTFLRALECGGTACLTKPFEVAALADRVEALLRAFR
jgi:DNA-binding response OmpR family regulator